MSMIGSDSWDVIVVGGGHAGCEAAAVAARCGARTALVTHDLRTIGAMSCNPAIGGVGKGHLAREVDALDGLIAKAADAAGIHFKVLNRSKGPAVRGPRVQADRARFAAAVRGLLAETPGLATIADSVEDLLVDDSGRVTGVVLGSGATLRAGAVVLTTGTFLRGEIHIGQERVSAGRADAPAALGLAFALERLRLPLGRMKTGTPPRIDGKTIAWSEIESQPGDASPEPLSWMTESIIGPQIACGITWTDASLHEFIRQHVGESAVYGGRIAAKGPRYCPSIEDKIVRFPERERQQIFLEPECLEGLLVYPNGLSTSLPPALQQEIVNRLPGLGAARIVRAGYAIAYDHVDPRALHPTLEARAARGLFLAGQINGTTGYEEAAAQGIMAGLNAAQRAGGAEPGRVFSRREAYIGVLIDDLVSQGVTEPYRMLTARAEHRLALRADNAALRLTAHGQAWGCVGTERNQAFDVFRAHVDCALARAETEYATPHAIAASGISVPQDGRLRTVLDVMAQSGATDEAVNRCFGWLADLPSKVREELANRALYAPYLKRNEAMVRFMERESQTRFSETLDYQAVPGLSAEMRQRLQAARPPNLGSASRVPGVTPGALTALAVYARRCFT